ncbi:hypothetical protein QFZ76_001961 [Streptomyces sp. V4I2]|nr:hypothetical protein [Streptomyces sp. V4I2]
MCYEVVGAIVVPMSTVTATRTAAKTASRPRPALDWRLRFGALSLIWGFSFLLIKVGTEGYAPFQVTLGRLVFGTAVLAAAMAVRRERLPRGARAWAHLTVAAFFLNALPFSLFAYAELTIPSTLAGICNATSPLWGMALSLVALSEDRPTRVRVAGLGLGFLGVLTVLGAWQGFHGLDASGTAMALLASLSYPIGWIYVRRTLAGSSHSNLSLTGAQLLLATLPTGGRHPAVHQPSDTLRDHSAAGDRGSWSPRHGPRGPPPVRPGRRGRPDDGPDGHLLHPGHRHRRRRRDPRRVAELVDTGRGGDRAGGGGADAGQAQAEALDGGLARAGALDVTPDRSPKL